MVALCDITKPPIPYSGVFFHKQKRTNFSLGEGSRSGWRRLNQSLCAKMQHNPRLPVVSTAGGKCQAILVMRHQLLWFWYADERRGGVLPLARPSGLGLFSILQ